MTLTFRSDEADRKIWNSSKFFRVKIFDDNNQRFAQPRAPPLSRDSLIPVTSTSARSSARAVPCLQHSPQRRVVSIVIDRIEQRPRFGTRQECGHGGDHQVAIVSVVDLGLGGTPLGDGDIYTAQGKNQLLERNARESAFQLPARYAGVLPIGIAFGQLTQLAADGVDRKGDDILVVCRNSGRKHEAEII